MSIIINIRGLGLRFVPVLIWEVDERITLQPSMSRRQNNWCLEALGLMRHDNTEFKVDDTVYHWI